MTDPTTYVPGDDVDHEAYAGEVIPDPWEDPTQEDWNNNPGSADEVVVQSSIGRVLSATSAAWVLTQNLKRLLTEFNILGPRRDHASDGTIGDWAHQNEAASGHNPDRTGKAEYKDGDAKNEVRALDVDSSGPFLYGQTMETCIQHLVAMARALYKAGKYFPLRYFIYKGRIWSVSSGWVTKKYTGASPHTEHAHFSGAYSQRADEDSTFNYGIATLGKPKDDFMSFVTNQEEFNAAMTAFFNSKAGGQTVLDALLKSTYGSAAYAGRTLRNFIIDVHGFRDAGVDANGAGIPQYSKVTLTTPWGQVLALPGVVAKAFADNAARDAQDAARDAGLTAAVNTVIDLIKSANGGTLHISDAQLQELKMTIGQKIVEAGQDASDQIHAHVTDTLRELDNGVSSDQPEGADN